MNPQFETQINDLHSYTVLVVLLKMVRREIMWRQ